MLDQNSLLLIVMLVVMVWKMQLIKGLQVGELVEPEQENTALPSDNSNLYGTADTGRVVYDQRQEGKYNIHVSIKDVAIIDMDQNKVEDDIYDEDEYYYDNGDLTVKPLILKSTTYKSIITNTTTPSRKSSTISSQILHTDTAANTADLNTENYSTQTITTTIINDADTMQPSLKMNSVVSDLHKKLQQQQQQQTKFGTHEKELHGDIARQTPESPIYNFKVTQQKQNQLQQTLAQFKEKQEQQQQQEQTFLKAFGNPLQQPKHQQQHVRYPTPMHQLLQNYHHQRQSQQQLLHSHCHANQYRDLTGNCQTRRGSSSTSATAILRKFFNMLVTLPLRDREHEDRE